MIIIIYSVSYLYKLLRLVKNFLKWCETHLLKLKTSKFAWVGGGAIPLGNVRYISYWFSTLKMKYVCAL